MKDKIPTLDFSALSSINPEVATAYENAVPSMLPIVDNWVLEHGHPFDMLGGNLVATMKDNHRNHARFMSVVFHLNAYDLLAKTIPWVYHTYHSLGFKYEYFKVELTAWKNAINERLSSMNAEQIIAVYEWIIANHDKSILIADSIGNTSQLSILPSDPVFKEFLRTLLDADHRESIRIAQREVLTAEDLPKFYDKVVWPSMLRIGALWEEGSVSVAQEHLATSIVGRAMASLYDRILNVGSYRGTAIVATVAEEYHELGARMVADLLEVDGWDVHYLGCNVPVADIVKICSASRPNLIALSVTMPYNLTITKDIISAIRSERRLDESKVMVGGNAFAGLTNLVKTIGADAYAESAERAVAVAREWGVLGGSEMLIVDGSSIF